ncbi:MAG: hypothetical protein HQK65_03325 [Desulfamplus sp.]|nr:hypothetical protein [Desulfamplus sp.]
MKKIVIIGLLVLFCMLLGCAKKNIIEEPTRVTLHFAAEKYINDGVLLPVDIIIAEGSIMDSILEIGPEKWFGHFQRDSLGQGELIPLAISGGEIRTKNILLTPGFNKIIIFADYEGNTDPAGQQLIIPQKKLRKEYRIKIKERELEIDK